MWTTRRRLVVCLGASAVLVAVAASIGVFGVLARGPSQEFPGTSAPGSHQWYSVSADVEATFCNACHSEIRDELTASSGYHQGDMCLSCHPAEPGQHAADPAMCADCHYSGGGGGGGDCHTCHGPSGPHPLSCLACHDIHGGTPPPAGHDQATELANDAHASFYAELGETPATASWVCKACHTQVSVEMTVTENPPLPLSIGPTYP